VRERGIVAASLDNGWTADLSLRLMSAGHIRGDRVVVMSEEDSADLFNAVESLIFAVEDEGYTVEPPGLRKARALLKRLRSPGG
jgi:hypothetical protein